MKKLITLAATLTLAATPSHASEPTWADFMVDCASIAEKVASILQQVGTAKAITHVGAVAKAETRDGMLKVLSAAARFSTEEHQSRAAYEACMARVPSYLRPHGTPY